MKKSWYVATVALALALALAPVTAGAASVSHGQRAMGMGMGTVTVPNVKAGPYNLTLVIGPVEPMYTVAQYRKLHPMRGEIVLRGAMMGGMGMRMVNRHIELQVMDRATMRVVPNAMVTMSCQPVVGMGMMALRPTTVPVAVLQGIGMSMMDIHYGNNVSMPRGSYHVTVHVNQAYATYTVRLM